MKTCFCVSNPTITALSIEHYAKEYEFRFDREFNVKNCDILKCGDCNAFWLTGIPSKNNIYYRIFSEWQMDLLEEWLANGTSASHLKYNAALIGSSSSEFIEFPCAATLNSGEKRDLCILTKWSHHPRISWPSIPAQNFLYASQVASIERSEYALSLNNRIAIRNATSTIHKDLVPLVFVFDGEIFFHDLGCKNYYFDSNFLQFKNIRGTDIKEVTQDIKTYVNCTEKDDLSNAVTLILFDQW